ncbi:MAG: hypothetical protein LBK98_01565 [Peptococcaceae bacterium]|jgi:putative ABC transport system permease protein|nr:hypothetical protein [Peptococcaceae bacterium]
MSAYGKNVLRAILGNKRRSLMILLITALGAAFFVGLRSTSPDMNTTFDRYFDRQAMYDIQVISVFGLTEKHLAALAEAAGVERAAPAYSADLFAKFKGASYLCRFHSLGAEGAARMAEPILVAGRLPETAGECAMEYRFSQMTGSGIGDELTLSTGDDSGLEDVVARTSYTITGFVESPLYIRADLGSSGKGSGTLDSYAYIPFDDFVADTYTEARITLANPAGFSRFDQRYKDLSAAAEEELRQIGEALTADRRRLLAARATREIAAGYARLADTRAALAAGEAELAAAAAELTAGEEDLERQRGALLNGIEQGQREYQAGEAALAAARQSLRQGWQALREGETALAEAGAGTGAGAGVGASASAGAGTGAEADTGAGNGTGVSAGMGAGAGVGAGASASAGAAAEAGANAGAGIGAGAGSSSDAAAAQAAALSAALLGQERRLRQGEGSLTEQERALWAAARTLDDMRYGGLAKLAAAEAELSLARDALSDRQADWRAAADFAERETAAAEKDLREARRALADLPEAKCYVLGLDQSLGFASYEQDSQRIDSLSYTFPLVFFLVAALVAFTSMVRIIEDDRPAAAAMRSLGYGVSATMGKYLLYALSVGVPGTILGLGIGYWLFPIAIFNFGYKIMYMLPPIATPLYAGLCGQAFAISLFSVIAPTILVSAADARQVPAVLTRPKAPPTGKRIFLENIPALWSAMSFSAKVTARNILRYKKRFLMTTTGIIGCTGIVLTGFGVRDSIRVIAARQFDQIFLYGMQITLSDQAGRSDRSALERYLAAQADVEAWQYQHRENVDAGLAAGRQYETVLVVPEDADRLSEFIQLSDPRSGAAVAPDGGTVVISQKLASLLGVSAGMEIVLTDGDDQSFRVAVGGVTKNYVGHYVYMRPEHYRALWEKTPSYTALLCRTRPQEPARRDLMSERILDNSGVSALSFNAVVRDFYADMINSLNVVVLILIVSGGLLAFVVLFSLTGINIDERKRELATLKVLGFFDREAENYIFRENMINTVIGVALGLLFGAGLHQYVVRTAEVDLVMFGKTIAPPSYGIAVGLTFLFTLIVNRVMAGSIQGIDMIESLKSVE